MIECGEANRIMVTYEKSCRTLQPISTAVIVHIFSDDCNALTSK